MQATTRIRGLVLRGSYGRPGRDAVAFSRAGSWEASYAFSARRPAPGFRFVIVAGAVNVTVELSTRELWLLIGPLEAWIKEMGDSYGMGMTDPDRESELQELRDLLEKLHAALIGAGAQDERES